MAARGREASAKQGRPAGLKSQKPKKSKSHTLYQEAFEIWILEFIWCL
jgi:hypothetical protein